MSSTILMRTPPPGPAREGRRPTKELAVAAREGCARSFEELVARFEEPLFNFLLVRTRCSADAEEVAQETFLRAWQNLARYDERWSFGTWLFTLARRLAVSRLRRASARAQPRRLDDDGEGLFGPGPAGGDPAELSSAREERRNLWTLARRVLGEEARSALWLRYAEDLSIEEVARVLGKRRVSVRVLLFRARAKLAEHLAPRPSSHAGTAVRGGAGHRPRALPPETAPGGSS